jgi:hypothetical protein
VSSGFLRKLRREIAASPKKAGLLAVLSVVALWFWAPLVMKSFSKSDAATTEVARPAGNSISLSAPVAAGPAPNAIGSGAIEQSNSVKSRLPSRHWQQLVAQIERDARMSPARELIAVRDPFKVAVVVTPAPKKHEAPVVEQPDLTPVSAGLVLNSTIVGRGEKRALIGGDVYEEGSTIAAAGGEAGFRVVEIRPREVVLERKGRLYTLDLPKSEWSKGQ